MNANAPIVQDAWTIPEWTKAARIAVSTYYTLDHASRPKSARVGRRVIIIESPGNWLRRVPKLGTISTTRAPLLAEVGAMYNAIEQFLDAVQLHNLTSHDRIEADGNPHRVAGKSDDAIRSLVTALEAGRADLFARFALSLREQHTGNQQFPYEGVKNGKQS